MHLTGLLLGCYFLVFRNKVLSIFHNLAPRLCRVWHWNNYHSKNLTCRRTKHRKEASPRSVLCPLLVSSLWWSNKQFSLHIWNFATLCMRQNLHVFFWFQWRFHTTLIKYRKKKNKWNQFYTRGFLKLIIKVTLQGNNMEKSIKIHVIWTNFSIT